MTRRFLIQLAFYIVLGIAVGIAIYYLWIRPSPNSVFEFSTVRDTFTDVTLKDAAVVYFIRVKAYDSIQIRAVADYYIEQNLTKPELSASKRRTILMHFFVEDDTASLSTDMLHELAYTHPEVTDPTGTLLLVPGGYVMKVVYAESARQPSLSELKRTSFYMARPGISAKDLR